MKPDWDDRKLVSLYLRRRDERAFRALYRRHTPRVYRMILRLVRGRTNEADDILQATWVRAAEKMADFEWRSSLRSWLIGIAINCYRESIRSARKDDVIVDAHDLSDVPQTKGLRCSISQIDLERAIAQLPNGYREVLILHDVEGYTHDEIGVLMGIRNGTSKSQLCRARRAMRKWLEPHTSPAEEVIDERRAV